MVKDKEGIKDPKSSSQMFISKVFARLAPNFGLDFPEMTIFS